jgi:hypothetical protein
MLRDWVAATVEARRRVEEDDVTGYLTFASRWNC